MPSLNDASMFGYKYYASSTFSYDYTSHRMWQRLGEGCQRQREGVACCRSVKSHTGGGNDALHNLC
jgi:hypothetical protein